MADYSGTPLAKKLGVKEGSRVAAIGAPAGFANSLRLPAGTKLGTSASGVATDLTFEPVQRFGLASGLVDNKVCAIDDTWSGPRFVYRVADRPRR